MPMRNLVVHSSATSGSRSINPRRTNKPPLLLLCWTPSADGRSGIHSCLSCSLATDHRRSSWRLKTIRRRSMLPESHGSGASTAHDNVAWQIRNAHSLARLEASSIPAQIERFNDATIHHACQCCSSGYRAVCSCELTGSRADGNVDESRSPNFSHRLSDLEGGWSYGGQRGQRNRG